MNFDRYLSAAFIVAISIAVGFAVTEILTVAIDTTIRASLR